MQKPYRVLLYYKYSCIENPKRFVEEHRVLCTELGLLGRILVGEEGLNGTLAGTPEATAQYMHAVQNDPRFEGIQFKVHESDVLPFRKLKIKARNEIVALDLEDDVSPDEGGAHLSPAEWDALAQQEDVVILDARNTYESVIGKFKNAVTPAIDHFRDFPKWVKENATALEGKKVLMYCTGGIRCEKASAVLKKEGLDDVYQLDGGIINYGKEIPDGLWEGSCFVFDERMKVQVNDDEHHEVISTCRFCDTRTDVYYNCCNAECNQLILLCDDCTERSNNACSQECSTKHRLGIVKQWDIQTRQAS